MSVSVEADVSSPLSDGQSTLDPTISKSSTDSQSSKTEDIGVGQDDKSEPSTPKPHPMAFTVDFGEAKPFDNRRLEELAKKSQARHQRVQSMSASFTRTTPASQRPPMSAKLPRKAQGYNSEGYFSSDQEDSGLSNSLKNRAQNITSPGTNRHVKSPVTDNFQPKRTSKSPIVDSIMSRSDNFTLNPRHGLNLPLRSNSYVKDVIYQPKTVVDIIDQSPEILLTDISSPELDILTPDNGLSTPEQKSPSRKSRASSETPDLFKKCIVNEALYIDDDIDRQSNSSTGTYTIEGDNYTEEQKARMSIDRNFANEACSKSAQDDRDPELLFDYSKCVITKEPRRENALRSPLSTNKTFDTPKVSKDKNVLEISCCYESPTENDLAAQTSKQIKSTRSYLEKIKNRVRTITEKTFAKSPPKELEPDADVGSFTSVTTSGVLSSSKAPPKVNIPVRRRCSLTKSEIDQTDYVHRIARESSVPVDYAQRMHRDSSVEYLQRLSRESSVPVSLPSSKSPFDDAKFESTALRNVQRAMRNDSGDMAGVSTMASDQVVGKLSYLSINRCKGDKTWIQDWADSVKKYNNVLGQDDVDERPPVSPRNMPGRTLSPHGVPSKIPSPVGTLLSRRTPDLIPTQDTEAYLQKTQNAITNLQAKLQSSRTSNFSSIPSQLTSSLISEKTAVSRLPVSQLSRSNSLNYRLRPKEHSNDSSPLRSPGHYVITGSSKLPESTKILLNTASRSLDAERRHHDHNMNSPSSDRRHSNSSDDKTLSNRPPYDVNAILSPHRKTHTRHKSFEGRNPEAISADVHNANATVCLKTVLKNNAEAYPRIDQARYQGDKKHQRVLSDSKTYKNSVAFGSSIKRSSSFNTVNKNNNYIEGRLTRRSSGQSDEYKDSDESDNGYDKSQERYVRQVVRGRIESPDIKSVAPANSPRHSPRCPNTPEMHRKFGPGLVRNSGRVPKSAPPARAAEPPREERKAGHQSRRISEPTRQAVLNRLTKSRSSTREMQRPQELRSSGPKKPSQYRSSSALATKEVELANWKKRSTYDPIKAAQEGKKRQQAKRQECNKDDLSSPSHSSPVHRSQSFHTTNMAAEQPLTPEYSSEETEDEQLALPADPMLASTCSDILDLRPRHLHFNYQTPSPLDKKRYEDKRKTYLIDDITPTKENIAFLPKQDAIDKRRTFIMDSDTTSTTNGSSPRASSVYSQGKSLLAGASDSDADSGPESAPVRTTRGRKQPPAQRYSGDYSMSSSTTSIAPKKEIQPRYLDISKYKNESSPKNFLRRDPSKTYVGVLAHTPAKPSKQHIEIEQKKQELEKWKRRASYDPRKAAALGKTAKPQPKTASSVLRSQSFHGPVLTCTSFRYQPPDNQISESYDASSDNDF